MVPPTAARVASMLAGVGEAGRRARHGAAAVRGADRPRRRLARGAGRLPAGGATGGGGCGAGGAGGPVQPAGHRDDDRCARGGGAGARAGRDARATSGAGGLGTGNRANACVGRAVSLALAGIGGATAGLTDMATIGSPAKYTCCTAEDGAGPLPSLAVRRGLAADQPRRDGDRGGQPAGSAARGGLPRGAGRLRAGRGGDGGGGAGGRGSRVGPRWWSSSCCCRRSWRRSSTARGWDAERIGGFLFERGNAAAAVGCRAVGRRCGRRPGADGGRVGSRRARRRHRGSGREDAAPARLDGRDAVGDGAGATAVTRRCGVVRRVQRPRRPAYRRGQTVSGTRRWARTRSNSAMSMTSMPSCWVNSSRIFETASRVPCIVSRFM